MANENRLSQSRCDSYRKIDESDISRIKTLIAAERVFSHLKISNDYSHDELGGITHFPDILVKVQNTAEVAAVMAFAYEQTIPVVVRGSGTGLVGASVAIFGGIMIEFPLQKSIRYWRPYLRLSVRSSSQRRSSSWSGRPFSLLKIIWGNVFLILQRPLICF